MTSIDQSLTRSRNRLIAGVCSGLAEYFQLNLILVRLAFVGLTFVSGIGIVLYAVLVFVIPGPPRIVREEVVLEPGGIRWGRVVGAISAAVMGLLAFGNSLLELLNNLTGTP